MERMKSMVKKPQTNADRIRSMTDEELAELLYSLQTEDLDGMFCKTEDKCEEMMDSGDEIPKSMCKQCLVKWLRAESEENNGIYQSSGRKTN